MMIYDQDFINDGYADGQPLRLPRSCPKCGRKICTALPAPVICRGRVRAINRKKGEPRMVPCGTIML